MRNFLIGLALGVLGAILWVVASVVAGLASAGECLEEAFPTPEPGAPAQFPTLTECDSGLFADPVSGSLVVVGFLVMRRACLVLDHRTRRGLGAPPNG